MHSGSNYMGLIIFTLLLLGIDLYVFQGIKTITQGWVLERNRLLVNWGYWVLSVLVIVSLFLAFGQLAKHSAFTGFVSVSANVFIVLVLSKLSFLIILFGEDIYRVFATAFNFMFKTGAETGYIPGRRKFISQAGLVVASLQMSSLLYGVVKGKYQYKLHKKTLYFDDLPEAFDGFTITQISDVHAGSFTDKDAVQRGVDMIKAQNSDLFVFTGDIVNNRADELVPWMDMFSQIKAKFGQFSILGNHDYGEYVRWDSKEAEHKNLDTLKEYHKDMGYRLLLNEGVKIEKDGESISLLGVENWGKGFVTKGDLPKALSQVDPESFKVLLSHDPTHWDEEVKNNASKIHLTLSGHTHGMQMGVETPKFKFSPVQFRYKNWAGLVEEAGSYLYVNRGFGFIGYSGRVGIWPEVTVLELKKGEPIS